MYHPDPFEWFTSSMVVQFSAHFLHFSVGKIGHMVLGELITPLLAVFGMDETQILTINVLANFVILGRVVFLSVLTLEPIELDVDVSDVVVYELLHRIHRVNVFDSGPGPAVALEARLNFKLIARRPRRIKVLRGKSRNCNLGK